MSSRIGLTTALLVTFVAVTPLPAGYSAHGNDRDMETFLSVYPAARGGRLDSCVLCHPSGVITGKHGQRRHVDACAHCHDVYKLTPPHGPVPLNVYGTSYLEAGRDGRSLRRIGLRDLDGDGVGTWREVLRETFPGDATDHPGLRRAPVRRFAEAALTALPRTSFTMLMNTHKSGDFYATYEGVSIEALLAAAGVAPEARRVTFFSPDGYHLTVPLRSKEGYYLLGTYPTGTFHPNLAWVTYPREPRLEPGAPLPGRPRAILAYRRDGARLPAAKLVQKGSRWILSAEGPLRLVLPQAVPCPPDQPSNDTLASRPYPFDEGLDHNAGASVRTVCALRVEPLPEGTTDFDWVREGWSLVGSSTLLVYGALAPRTGE